MWDVASPAARATTRAVSPLVLEHLLRGYYWYARPLLVLLYFVGLLKGRAFVHPLDLMLLALLWCFPYWIRLRLLPAAHRRDPQLAALLRQSLESIEAARAKSGLPWVRA